MALGLHTNLKLGFVYIASDIGITGGYSYEYNASEGVEVGGVVGSIPDEAAYNGRRFRWGLMMIPREFNDQKFSLVTYWVTEFSN